MRWLDVRRLNSKSPDKRWNAALSLADQGDPRGIDVLLNALKPGGAVSGYAIAQALRALTGLRRREALEPALAVLVQGDTDIWTPYGEAAFQYAEAAVHAVAALGDRGTARRILTLLEELDRDLKQNSKAAVRLPDALRAIVDKLEPSERARSLVRLGNPQWAANLGVVAIPALLGAVDNGDEKAARVLRSMPGFSPTEEQELEMACVLGEYGKVAQAGAIAIPSLVRALSREAQPKRRIAIANALGKIGGEGVVEALVELLNNTSEDENVKSGESLRNAAARALGEIKDPRAANALHAVAKNGSGWVLSTSENAIQKMKGEAALELMGLRSRDPLNRDEVCDADRVRNLTMILDAGPDAPGTREAMDSALKSTSGGDILAEALTSNDKVLRVFAEGLVKDLTDGRFLEKLSRAITDNRPQIKRLAVQHLSHVNSRARIKQLDLTHALIGALQDSDLTVRAHAARVLGMTEDAEAVDPLLALLNDDNDGVREAAACALGDIRDQRAFDPLMKALTNWQVMPAISAARSIAHFHDPAAVPALLSFATSNPKSQHALDPLQWLLERCASKVDSQELKMLATLDDVIWIKQVQEFCAGISQGFRSEEHKVSRAQLRQLARQELVRRGIGV